MYGQAPASGRIDGRQGQIRNVNWKNGLHPRVVGNGRPFSLHVAVVFYGQPFSHNYNECIRAQSPHRNSRFCADRFLPRAVAHRLRVVRRRVQQRLLARAQERAQRRGQTSIVVVGPRRSGHHAIISWIVSGLEGEAVSWVDVIPRRVVVSLSGRTVHLNNVGLTPSTRQAVLNGKIRRIVRRAQYVVVNYEDQDLRHVERMSRLPKVPDVKVYVTRSTLNLVASRLRGMDKAWAVDLFAVDESWLSTLVDNAHPPEGWTVVDFDDWSTDDNGYRSARARDLGLTANIAPPVSRFGEGSSFGTSVTAPSSSELTTRYQQIDWPPEVVAILVDPRFRSVLSDQEFDFLRSIG